MTASTSADTTRRDFLYLATGAASAVGVGLAAWPLIDQMNPSAAVRALSSTEVDVTPVKEGQQIVVMWRSKPVFIRKRTAAEIAKDRAIPMSQLIDGVARNANLPENAPATDQNRAAKPEWVVLVGICTHLGCIPLFNQGSFGGYFCPCHGSEYDASGRVLKGPAPENLYIPPYAFTGDTTIKIG